MNKNIEIVQENISLQEKLKLLPCKAGVYQFKDSTGKVIYIGKASNLRNRVRQYFTRQEKRKYHQSDNRINLMTSKIADFEIIVTDSDVEALILEATLIKKFKPRYNINLKDDKSYPYIVVTNEPYPRILVTRRTNRDDSDDSLLHGKYFGPYTDVKTMRSALKIIYDTFKIRSCNYYIDKETIRKRKIRVCLDYHIKKCEGPCENLISFEKYNAMISEIIQVLKGKTKALVADLEAKMHLDSEKLNFEEAAEIRDKIFRLNVYNQKQKIVDTELRDRDFFAVALEHGHACGVVFKVREGKIVGRHHIYMTAIENKSESEFIERFIQHFYLNSDDIPPEIFLHTPIETTNTIKQWLATKRGQSVSIKVPKIGIKANLMEMCKKNAKILLDELQIKKLREVFYIPTSLKALQRDLRLTYPPRRIECFDVSNLHGSDCVASMVVFIDGKPKKSHYRRFRIRNVIAPDDFSSIREVIERRFKNLLGEQKEKPDLIVIDGGKGQLSSAIEVLDKLGLRKRLNIPIISLAKRLEEVFLPESNEPQSIPRTSSSLRLLQQIRDEAHRFAISYHKKLRNQRTFKTELNVIKGIGRKRAKDLLKIFGSVQGVKSATTNQLAEVVGEKLAVKIKEYFGEEKIIQ